VKNRRYCEIKREGVKTEGRGGIRGSTGSFTVFAGRISGLNYVLN